MEEGLAPTAREAGGLQRGGIHEWLGVAPATSAGSEARPRWTPPLCLLAHLARQALIQRPRAPIFWIGRTCWPHARTLAGATPGSRALLAHSIFVDAHDAADRLWAMDLALRCTAAGAVMGDGRGFDIAATRRLQLAAESTCAIGLLARPPTERHERSTAVTRCFIRRAASNNPVPGWEVELLCCKGSRPGISLPMRLHLEFNHATGTLCVPAPLVDRTDATTFAATVSLRAG